MRRLLCGAAIWGLLSAAGPSAVQARPDLDASLQTLVEAPLSVTGAALGGAGLLGAAVVGLAADLVALADDNPVSRPLLRGFASSGLRRLALGLSWTSTGWIEGLRAEDIERLPEARETYLTNAPGVGRLDTASVGVRAIGLAVGDAIGLPPLAFLQLIGADEAAQRQRERRKDARISALGPSPAAASP